MSLLSDRQIGRLTRACLFAALFAAAIGGTASAQQVQTTGVACTGPAAAFWEQSSLCPSGSSTWQRPAFQFGASTNQSCSSSLTGMVQWTGTGVSPNNILEYCDGTQWNKILTAPSSGSAPASSGDGYFVLSASTYNGNLGGLSGANSTCLTDLTANNWMGKTDATTRGMLNSSQIKAFLCDGPTCNAASASTRYYFAVSGNAAMGGGYFDADASGLGPNNSTSWSAASYFGSTYSWWSGRDINAATVWRNSGWGPSGSSTYNCTGWASTSSNTGLYGNSSGTDGSRWGAGGGTSCTNSLRLICIVNPTAPGTSCGFNSGTYSSGGTATTLTVPAGCPVTFKAWGGGGATGYPDATTNASGRGGGGGYSTITISATGSPVTYYLGVGGAGSTPPSCFQVGPGGSGISNFGGGNSGSGGCSGGGAGAATGVWTGSYGGTPVIVAGGGGGGGGSTSTSAGTDGGAGGAADSGGGATTQGTAGSATRTGGGGGGYLLGGSVSASAGVGGRGGNSYAASGGTAVAGSGTNPGNSGDSNRPSGAGNGGSSNAAGGVGQSGTDGALYYSY